MNIEKQRLTIAKACGWTRIEKGPCRPLGRVHDLFAKYDFGGTPPADKDKPEDEQSFVIIPEYVDSLDAMHEAETYLLSKQSGWTYIRFLKEVVGLEWIEEYTDVAIIVHATAAQRAEAFLKTLNLWEKSL